MDDINQVIEALKEAKQDEADAKALRLSIESDLADLLGIGDEFTGTRKGVCGNNTLTVVGRTITSIDTAKLLEIADNNNCQNLINSAFNVKLSIIKKQFDLLSDDQKKLFSDAITEKPAKISFKIEQTKEI